MKEVNIPPREVNLKFYLPEAYEEAMMAVHAEEYLALLWDIDQKCRSFLKNRACAEDAGKLAEEIRSLINDGDVFKYYH